MKLMEYQAREVFAAEGIPMMPAVLLSGDGDWLQTIEAANLRFPVAVKAQVPVGGRGKAGGVQFADDARQAADWAGRLMGMHIQDCIAGHVLVVEKAEPLEEWYLSMILDRAGKMPLVLFSRCGGVDIEQTALEHPESIVRVPVDPFIGVQDYALDYLVNASGIDPVHKEALKRLIESLLKLFFSHHALLLEINPLIVSGTGGLIALDGKVDIDDAALYKLPAIKAYRYDLAEHALVLEARRFSFLYIPVEAGGRVGVMSNGSGMLMSCIDQLAKRGLHVSGALDLGGGSTAERIREAVRILLSTEGIGTLLISIFGGITRCDEVAEGLRQALLKPGVSARVVVRMEGTNRQVGLDILSTISDRAKVAASLTEAVEQVYSLTCAEGETP